MGDKIIVLVYADIHGVKNCLAGNDMRFLIYWRPGLCTIVALNELKLLQSIYFIKIPVGGISVGGAIEELFLTISLIPNDAPN